MVIFFLEKIRKLFKSIGKKERIIDDFITYYRFNKIKEKFNLNENQFNKTDKNSENFKIVATIAFFFNSQKILNLKKVCKNLNELSNNVEIYIFSNGISVEQKDQLKKDLEIEVQIISIEDIIHDRLLPWYHYNLMRKVYENTEVTHFIYLEDDILIDKENFNYWINSRKILKKFNLIPGFIRTEVNHEDKELYAIDFVKKNNFKYLPKVSIDKNYYFVNHKYPYQGMYLYDRELMKEHLFGPSSNPDCGHGAFDVNYIDPKMINLDLMAKANIGLTYVNTPYGFFNRMVSLYNKDENKIDNKCLIKHLSNKYSNTKSWHGNIKVKDAIK